MPHAITKKRLNIRQKRTVPGSYGGNLNEAKQACLGGKMARDFSIGSRNNLLQQIDTFVVALAVSPEGTIVYWPLFC
jgi:hypothetical protein